MGGRWRQLALAGAVLGCSSSGDPSPGLSSGLGGTTAAGTDGDAASDANTGTGVATMWGVSEGTTSSGTSMPTATTSQGVSSGPGDDACAACAQENCATQLACDGSPECVCWRDCLLAGTSSATCTTMCGSRPDEADELAACLRASCPAACGADDGGSSTGATGGISGGGMYDKCDDDAGCDGGLVCNPIPGHCSQDCAMGCPDPPDADAQPACDPTTDLCILLCDAAQACPDRMSCQMIDGLEACVY